jgi:hypothetical protein
MNMLDITLVLAMESDTSRISIGIGKPTLTLITLPDGVTSIGHSAFASCTNLTSIAIPDKVTTIKTGAFVQCAGLTSITLPAEVSYIGFMAFKGCNSLQSITNLNPVPIKIGDIVFAEMNQSECELIVSSDSKDAYSTASVWKDFDIGEYYIVTVIANHGNVTGNGRYNTNYSATVSVTPSLGYEFVSWTGNGTVISIDNPYTFTVTQNMELRANLKARSYDIIYALDGGENHINNSNSYTIENSTIRLQNPSRRGYDFTRWLPGNTLVAGSTGDKIFTATWTLSSYVIRYVLGSEGKNHIYPI